MPDEDKRRSLLTQGTLNPRARSVKDGRFQEQGGFFDSRDIVQVKYEMLRRVRVDGEPISHTATDFGFSRVALYAALAAFDARGLAALVPRKRGPHQGHKLTDAVVDFIHEQLVQDPSLDVAALSELVGKHLGRSVHPRSIKRALRKKKPRAPAT